MSTNVLFSHIIAEVQHTIAEVTEGIAEAKHTIAEAPEGIAEAKHTIAEAPEDIAEAKHAIAEVTEGIAKTTYTIAKIMEYSSEAQECTADQFYIWLGFQLIRIQQSSSRGRPIAPTGRQTAILK